MKPDEYEARIDGLVGARQGDAAGAGPSSEIMIPASPKSGRPPCGAARARHSAGDIAMLREEASRAGVTIEL